jgi:dipeptidyl aminopeptidase/acylaminoacyl peptidase
VRDGPTGKLVSSWASKGEVTSVSFSQRGLLTAVHIEKASTLQLRTPSTLAAEPRWTHSMPGRIRFVVPSPDERYLVVESILDGSIAEIRVLEVATGERVASLNLRPSGDLGEAAAFLPDGRTFLLATVRGVILRYEICP